MFLPSEEDAHRILERVRRKLSLPRDATTADVFRAALHQAKSVTNVDSSRIHDDLATFTKTNKVPSYVGAIEGGMLHEDGA